MSIDEILNDDPALRLFLFRTTLTICGLVTFSIGYGSYKFISKMYDKYFKKEHLEYYKK